MKHVAGTLLNALDHLADNDVALKTVIRAALTIVGQRIAQPLDGLH